MTQPTQQLPSWLSLSTTVVTYPDGSVSTASTTLQLPLTYYGPSIPLGTNGVWVYGGLTPPPSTTPTPTSATPTSTSLTSAITSAPSTSPTSSTSSSVTSPPSLSASSASTSASLTSSSSAAPTAAAGGSHGISITTLGAILGSIIGTLLILILLAIWYLLRQSRRRKAPTDGRPESSSFWNRSTTLMSTRLNRTSTVPIWTGWEIVTADDAHSGPRSPGEGSPRGSGEEDDPFLTRHSVHSGTDIGHARTDTDTLVSLPIIARTGTMASHRSSHKLGGPIIPREVQMRMDEEMGDVPPYASVRMVERRPSNEVESPLLPPRPLMDSLGVTGRRPASNPSLGSEKSKATDNARSIISEKSDGTDLQEPEGAELLTARRVKVGQIQPLVPQTTGSSSVGTSSISGLDRLANLGRMSWFKRMSFLGAPSGSQPVARSEQEAESDSYTRTPPRHSRHGSRSRPGSARVSAHEPTTDSFGRRVRNDSGVGFGLTAERPISSVSAHSAASGNTVFYDAHSRPGSSMGTRSTGNSGSSTLPPPVPPLPQAHYPQPSPLSHEVSRSSAVSASSNSSYGQVISDNPPTYETATAPQSRTGVQYSDLDVLDMPAPRPASPFSAASGSRSVPPGLAALPNPTVWRDSHASSSSPATDGTSGIGIDVLEEAPPPADGHWLNIAGGLRPTDGRRTTFGVVVQPSDALQSERGSLHSTRSHLSPYSSRSPSGSAAASSRRVATGSSSSHSHSHSRGPTGGSSSLAHSQSISFDDHRPGRHLSEVGEVGSPPLSAVFPGRGFPTGSPPLSPSLPPLHGDGNEVLATPPSYPAGAPIPIPIPKPAATRLGGGSGGGTMTSADTRGTGEESLTSSSVTTTETDPITGAVVHLPRMPWRSAGGRAWGERPEAMW